MIITLEQLAAEDLARQSARSQAKMRRASKRPAPR